MVIYRIVFGLLLLASMFCFGMALVTRDVRWRHRGVKILTWTLVAVFGFFAVLLLANYLQS